MRLEQFEYLELAWNTDALNAKMTEFGLKINQELELVSGEVDDLDYYKDVEHLEVSCKFNVLHRNKHDKNGRAIGINFELYPSAIEDIIKFKAIYPISTLYIEMALMIGNITFGIFTYRMKNRKPLEA